MNNWKLINIIGIDGAGKTTLAKHLVNFLLQKGDNIKYVYCQYFAKLLFPMKFAAKLTVMRKTDEFEDYSAYNKTKKTTSTRFTFLSQIYAGIWMADYIIQLFFKVSIPLFFGKKLVVDRYIFDTAVNISLTTNNSAEYACKLIAIFSKLLHIPDKIFFIDLPEEIAFGRKNDIQSLEYLKERRERYLFLAEKFDFHILNGLNTQENLLNQVLEILYEQKNQNIICSCQQ